MKKLFLLGLLGLFVAFATMGPAPALNTQSQLTASMVIDSQWTGVWKVAESLIVIKTDTCYTYYHATATVTLQPGQRLYYGLKDGATGVLDTIIAENPDRARKAVTFKIGAAYVDSLKSQTDANDSIQFVAAVAGKGKPQRVTLTDIRLTASIVDIGL